MAHVDDSFTTKLITFCLALILTMWVVVVLIILGAIVVGTLSWAVGQWFALWVELTS